MGNYIMRKLIVFLLLAGFAATGAELVSSAEWPENGGEFPAGWSVNHYKTDSEIKLLPGRIVRISAAETASGYIGKRAKCELPAGTMVEATGRYRTRNLELAADGFVRVNVNFNGNDQANRRAMGLNLTPSPEWKTFSRKLLLPVPLKEYFAFYQFYKGKGEVEFADLAVTASSDEPGSIAPNALVVWKEAEDCMTGGSISAHGRDIPGYFSGKGGYYLAGGKLTYRFQVKPEIDQQSLLPLERDYYIWGRIYGYRDCPGVKVSLDRKDIYEFTTRNTEREIDGKVDGQYYWQRLGAFRSGGASHELLLSTSGRLLADALVFTTDANYTPDKFEARERGGDFFTDLKIPVMLNPDYAVNGIGQGFVSPLVFRFVTPDNKPVAQLGAMQIRLPAGVTLHGVTSQWAGLNWKGRAPEFLTLKETAEADGRKSYDIGFSHISLSVTLFLEATSAESVQLEYSFVMYGVNQPWSTVNLEPVRIADTPAFRQIRVGPAGENFRGFFTDYPGLPELCRRFGINLLNPWHLYPAQYPGLWQGFSAQAAANGIRIIGEHSPRLGAPPEDERAIGLDGKPDRKPSILVRPDSAWVKQDLDKIAELGKYVDTIVIDDENTNMAGDRIDYHPELLAMFRESTGVTTPVREIVGDRQRYRREYEQWVDFKCEMMSRHYQLYLEAARRHNPNAKLIPQIVRDRSPEELRRSSFWDYRKLTRYVDRISPMIYTYQGIRDSALVGDTIAMHSRELGRPVAVPTLLSGHTGFGQVPTDEKPMYKYQLWECLMERADTVLYWNSAAFFNPVNLRHVADGIRTAVPYEEFFLKGTPVEISDHPDWLRIKALRLGKQLLVYAANYRNDRSLTATVTLPGGKKLDIDFKPDRARFYLIAD